MDNKVMGAVPWGEAEMEEKTQLVVAVVGTSQCGKTKLIHKFAKDTFQEKYSPTGFDKIQVTHHVGSRTCHFTIWDTSGSESYSVLRPLVYREADVVLVCYSLSDEDGLDTVPGWVDEVRKHCTASTPLLLCGCQTDLANKDDLERALAVSEEVEAVKLLTCSAKTGEDVEQVFDLCASAHWERTKVASKPGDQRKVIRRPKRPLTLNCANSASLQARANPACLQARDTRTVSHCIEERAISSAMEGRVMEYSQLADLQHLRPGWRHRARGQRDLGRPLSAAPALSLSQNKNFHKGQVDKQNQFWGEEVKSRNEEHFVQLQHRTPNPESSSPRCGTPILVRHNNNNDGRSIGRLDKSHTLNRILLEKRENIEDQTYEEVCYQSICPSLTPRTSNISFFSPLCNNLSPSPIQTSTLKPGLISSGAQVRPSRLCRRTTLRTVQAQMRPVSSPMSPNCDTHNQSPFILPPSLVQSPTESLLSSDIYLPFLKHKSSDVPDPSTSFASPAPSLQSHFLSPQTSNDCSSLDDPAAGCLSPTFTSDPLPHKSLSHDMSDNSSVSGGSHTGSTSVSCKQIPFNPDQRQCQRVTEEGGIRSELDTQTSQDCFPIPWTDKRKHVDSFKIEKYRTSRHSRKEKCIIM